MGTQMMGTQMNSSGSGLRTFIYSFYGKVILALFVVAIGVAALFFGIEEKSLYRILVAGAVLLLGVVGIIDAVRSKGKESKRDIEDQ